MDVFAHAFWTAFAFRKKKLGVWATLMGVMPDLLSFGIYFAILLTGVGFGKQQSMAIPGYVTFLYNLTHSLFIAGIFGIFVYLKYRKYLLLMGGWMMHITIDIFTHTDAFFPTHILYPVSNFHISVTSWANIWFMIANYTALMTVYGIIGYKRLKKKFFSM